jgi:hypothetical protein
VYAGDSQACNVRKRQVQRNGPSAFTVGWFDEECKRSRAAVQEARERRHLDPSEWIKARGLFGSLCKLKKRDFIRKRVRELNHIVSSDMRNVWTHVDRLIGTRSKYMTKPVVRPDELKGYFSKAFSADRVNIDNATNTHVDPKMPDTPITPDTLYISEHELRSVIKLVQKGKAPGIDGMSSDVLCNLCMVPNFYDLLLLFVNVIVHIGYWPSEWNKLMICPVLKPGKDPSLPDSYRPIHLICVLAKLVSGIIATRMLERTGPTECQLGFLADHGPRDNILLLNTILDKYRSVGGLYVVFVDFKAAFDTIDRTLLINKLRDMDVLDPLFFSLFKASLHDVSASIKGEALEWFREATGVKQGCPSGPRSFVTFIADLPSSVCPDRVDVNTFAVYLFCNLIRALLWADDLVLFSRTIKGMQQQLDALHEYARVNCLTVNVSKTKAMGVGTKKKPIPTLGVNFKYGPDTIEFVPSFKYVGAWVNMYATVDTHVDETIKKARHAMFACMSKVNHLSPNCNMYMKCMLFKAYVMPHLLYSCEVMPYTKRHVVRMNDIIVDYARWATSLPKHTKSDIVLCEAGLRPLHFDIAQARINYMCLLKSRKPEHPTNIALNDILSRKRCSMYKWYTACIESIASAACTRLLKIDVCNLSANIIRDHLKHTKATIKQAVTTWWAASWGPPPPTATAKFTPLLLDLSHIELVCIHTTSMHLYSCSFAYIYRYTQWWGWVDCGSSVSDNHRTYLTSFMKESLRLFRVGTAPAFMGADKFSTMHVNRFRRFCPYCVHIHSKCYIIDAFHTLFECPLFEIERQRLCKSLSKRHLLSKHGLFQSLMDLCVALLSPLDMCMAIHVGTFLGLCITKLDMFKAGLDGDVMKSITYNSRWSRAIRNRAHVDKFRSQILDVYTRRSTTKCALPWRVSNMIYTWTEGLVVNRSGAQPISSFLPDNWRDSVDSRVSSKVTVKKQ